MRELSGTKKQKGEQVVRLCLVVGADGFEPPTYAL
jgi:hypothetical protein